MSLEALQAQYLAAATAWQTYHTLVGSTFHERLAERRTLPWSQTLNYYNEHQALGVTCFLVASEGNRGLFRHPVEDFPYIAFEIAPL